MLGAGFVTKPTLEILAKSGITVSVGMSSVTLGLAVSSIV